eukprot:gene14242-16846_t
MSATSVFTPPMGATSRLGLDNIFSRNVGARYRATPQSPAVVLVSVDEKRALAVLQSTWDVDIVKHVAKDTLGNKEFQRVIRDAAALLEGLKHANDDAHADPPPERRFGDRQKGGGGV